MKFILSAILLMSSCRFFAQTYNTKEFNHLIEAESKSFTNNNKSINGAIQTTDYDLKYHRLQFEIDPAINYIKGAITSYFQPVVAGFNQMYFDCSNALTIDSIMYHGISLSYTQPTGNVLQITLPSVLPQNVLDSITVYYQGIPVTSSNGFGAFIQSSHNNDSIIWTLSEPYGALEWWPCKQDLNDKIDSIDVIVTTPQQYRVASQGLLVSETQSGTNKIYHWKHRYPIAAYLISVAITNYAVYTDVAPLSTGNLNILNYVFPEDSATAVVATPSIIPIIQLYDSLFGAYPFMNEKYGHAQFGWGGGMEHQTMSSVVNFSFALMAHELAHQWFGDKVTCASWSEIWLNEGFATYLTGLSYKYLAPTYWKAWKTQTLNSIISLPDGSVYNTDTTSVSRTFNGRLTYRKGAYLLRMLEWKLGQTTFYQGLNNYLNDVNLAYGYARTTDLQAHLEAVSGQNLTEFFNDWYYGQGYPSYQIYWNQIGTSATFTVNQTQSDPSVIFYEMPIPIYVKSTTGQDTTLVFNHTYSGQVFNATVPFTIDSVFFDPDLWLISGNSVVVGVNENMTLQKSVQVFPNPTHKTISVLLNQKNKVKEILIFDLIGNKIQANWTRKDNNSLQIDSSKLAAGTYILEIHLEHGVIRKKINKI